jgi:thymidylate kinase
MSDISEDRGYLIDITGLPLSGKTSVVDFIGSVLGPHMDRLLFTKNPGGTTFGRGVKNLLENQTKLEESTKTLMSRAGDVEVSQKVLFPGLAEKRIIICDRSIFDGVYFGCDDPDIAQPDLTLVLDIRANQSAKRYGRIKKANPAVNMNKPDRKLLSITKEKLEQHIGLNPAKYKIINGTCPLSDLQNACLKALTDFFKNN